VDKHLIVVCGNDPQYLGRAFQLIKIIEDLGACALVLDLSRLNPKIGNEYQPHLLDALRMDSPTKKFHAKLRALKVEFVYPNFFDFEIPVDVHSNDIQKILDACESAIISYARDPNPNLKNKRLKRLYDELYVGGLKTLSSVRFALASLEVSEIYIPNSRFPHNRASIIGATDAGVAINFYEKGSFSESIYLQPYSALDRIASQKDVSSFLAKYPKQYVESTGEQWLQTRMPNNLTRALNSYVKNFDYDNRGDIEHKSLESEWVGIFTSSQDEFASLGKDWHLHEWSDQYSAIAEMISQIGSERRVFLRVHPNFATKSHRAYKSELKQITLLKKMHPNLKVFMHDDTVNSYELIKLSSVVVVWNSTIGLEAMMLGKHVIALAPSLYDEYTGVSRCFSKGDFQGDLVREPMSTLFKAKEFAAYLSLREIPITESTRELIQEFDIPRGIRRECLKLLTTGGNPSSIFVLAQLVDTLRHRRLRNSIRHLLR
jgi:hypothetical protein